MDNILTRSDNERTTLLIPALRSFYDWAADVAWLIIRLTAGLMLLPHGIPKVLEQGIAAFAAAGLARRGLRPAAPLASQILLNATPRRAMLAGAVLSPPFPSSRPL